MTSTLELSATHTTTEKLSADDIYNHVIGRLGLLEQNLDHIYGKQGLGLEETVLTEYAVPGRHRYALLNETSQASGAFKSNGFEVAVDMAVQEAAAAGTPLKAVATSSAGNAGAALTIAANRHGLKSIVNTPRPELVSNVKLARLQKLGADVRPYFDSPEDGLADAESHGQKEGTLFMHPYNNLEAISGLALVGLRIFKGLRAQHAEGTLDLYNDPIQLQTQLGGGSLGTALACVTRYAKEQGWCGDNLIFKTVRPELVNGKLDRRYDGLYVKKLGSIATTVLSDSRFVQGHTTVSELESGLAAHRLAGFLHKQVEPAGLAGAAVFEKEAPQNDKPTMYVSVVTGGNVTPEVYEDFRQAPARFQKAVLSGFVNATLTSLENDTNMGGNVLVEAQKKDNETDEDGTIVFDVSSRTSKASSGATASSAATTWHRSSTTLQPRAARS